jgi:excisionase family DNA binding protein
MKKSLTSGEIAKYCEVSLRTAIRWIEKGHLKAYKLPGRGDNRVKVTDFLKFLKKHDMPIPEIFQEEKLKILIVDDEVNMASAIERSLKQSGFNIRVETDSFKVGVALASFEPDLITLDLAMPGMNGFEIIRFIRESQEFQHVKLLVISALPQEQLNRALEAGADAVLEKPYSSRVLIQHISNLLACESLVFQEEEI